MVKGLITIWILLMSLNLSSQTLDSWKKDFQPTKCTSRIAGKDRELFITSTDNRFFWVETIVKKDILTVKKRFLTKYDKVICK